MVDLLNYKKNSTSSSFVQTSIGRLLARKKGQCDTYQVLLKYYSMIKSTTLKKIGENKLSTFFRIRFSRMISALQEALVQLIETGKWKKKKLK